MDFPSSILVIRATYWSDGGTITIEGISDEGTPHILSLAQRTFPRNDAGCLYFNKGIVPIRSELERQVINLLKNANISYRPREPEPTDRSPLYAEQEDNIRRLCAKVIAFVESDEYSTLACRI
jgi:hypothetical protein